MSLEKPEYLILYEDISIGRFKAPYATEAEAVEQALQDLTNGREVVMVQHVDGTVLHSLDSLIEMLGQRANVG